MKTTFEIRSLFDKLIQELPEKTRQELSVRYNYSSILHGTIDVIIERGNQCMALGRFRTVSEESPSDFCERFRQAMGYPDDTWYLFDYDGKNMVINDLSLSEPVDEFPATPEEGLRRLIFVYITRRWDFVSKNKNSTRTADSSLQEKDSSIA